MEIIYIKKNKKNPITSKVIVYPELKIKSGYNQIKGKLTHPDSKYFNKYSSF